MSETEHKTGFLVDTGKPLTEYLADHEIDDYYDSEEEYLHDNCDAVIFEGTVWEIQDDKEVCEDGDIFKSKRISDCLISYEVKYYNGGCGSIEAINEALDNIKEK